MEFRFGADVLDREENTLGSLQRAIYDPGTRQVVALVATEGGLNPRPLVVPIGAVARSDADSMMLELSREQFAGLDEYVASARNIAPPPDVDEIDADEITEPIDIPDVPPVGAATGVESIAFTPIIEETTTMPAVNQVLDSGTAVWARDGDVGQLRSILVSDETHRLSAIILGGAGTVGGSIEVPAGQISSIQTGTIILVVDRATVESRSSA